MLLGKVDHQPVVSATRNSFVCYANDQSSECTQNSAFVWRMRGDGEQRVTFVHVIKDKQLLILQGWLI